MIYGQRVLKLEDPNLKGEDVRQLQIKIVAFGAKDKPVSCDGVFGPNTEKAVKKYQKWFELEETGVVDGKAYKALDDWGDQRKAVMEKVLTGYKCNHGTIPEVFRGVRHQDGCNRVWNRYVKGKLPIGESGEKAGEPNCNGFGSGLEKVVITKASTYEYSTTRAQSEHEGIDKILFWLIMGIMKIYGVNRLQINNGYRCQYKYFFIRARYGNASISNHTGHALDFLIPGTDVKRPNGSTLSPRKLRVGRETAAKRDERKKANKKHCNEIRDDLKEFGVIEKLKGAPANTPRTEPRSIAPTWVHLDTTVFKKHEYVTTVAEALAPKASGAYALPVDLSDSLFPTRETLAAYYAHTETKHTGGYYPIGANTIWHGGVHLRQKKGSRIVVPTSGKLVAARLAPDEENALGEYGSRNFVLLQHELNDKTFFSLYMHLNRMSLGTDNEALKEIPWLGNNETRYKIKIARLNFRSKPEVDDETLLGQFDQNEIVTVRDRSEFPWVQVQREGEDRQVWVKYKSTWQQELKVTAPDAELLDELAGGKVTSLEREVGAGEPLWSVGEYGSPEYRTGLIHWEIFSEENLCPEWPTAEDPDADCTLDSSKIIELVEQDPSWFASDDVLTLEEVKSFYKNNNRASKLRRYACKFVSEWGFDIDKALDNMKGRWFTDHLKDRITPYLWWDEAKDAGVPLPGSKQVWHYNPIRFIAALANGELTKKA